MALRNVMVFATLDTGKPGWSDQGNKFAGTVQKVLRDLSFVHDLTARQAGKMRVAGGVEAMVRALVHIPVAADDPSEKRRGSNVAWSLKNPLFRSYIDQELKRQTGYESAIIDLDNSLATAILQMPPGLILEEPPVGVSMSLVERQPYDYWRVYSVILDGDVPAGGTAGMNLSLVPSVAIINDKAYYEDLFAIWAANGAFVWPLTNILGLFDVSMTVPCLDATTYNLKTITTAPDTVDVQKDGVSVGIKWTYGTVSNAQLMYHMVRVFPYMTCGVACIIDGMNIVYAGYFESPTDRKSMAEGSSAWVWTNNTGATVPAGTHLADLTTHGEIIVEEF